MHFYRNVFTNVPSTKVKDVAAMLKAIQAQEDRQVTPEKAHAVAEKLKAKKLHTAAKTLEEGILETLSFTEFLREHWRKLRTNNPMERIMREIRRRTRVVGNFLDGNSALMLVTSRLSYIAGRQWGTWSYMNMDPLFKGDIGYQITEA